jgi:endonuclease/exonuclease/phosphatase family metal-dependent hydrolase
MTLRFLSFNVGNGLAAPSRLTAALRDSTADVIGLEEVTDAQAAALDELRDLYPFQAVYPAGIDGKALLSRLPFETVERLSFHPERSDLVTTLSPQDGIPPLRVIVAHPPPHISLKRKRQMHSLIQLAASGQPTVIMGDFNMGTLYEGYRLCVRAGLIDSFREAGIGDGRTFPVRRGSIPLTPLVRLDMIWHTRELRATRAWVGDDHGSDHKPLFADLEFIPAPN